MAVIGPDYQFLWASVGANGRVSDSTIWNDCDLRRNLASNCMNLPERRALPGRIKPVPYLLTGDDAFSLTPYLLKPYPMAGLSDEQRIFNYRLSRMRRISENAFGILANR